MPAMGLKKSRGQPRASATKGPNSLSKRKNASRDGNRSSNGPAGSAPGSKPRRTKAEPQVARAATKKKTRPPGGDGVGSPEAIARVAGERVANPLANSMVVVAVGASAGGLDAFRQLLAAMPADSGLAFVLIQHLDPTHMSLTAELLDRHTSLSVAEAEDDMRVEPNHVYVIPPNAYITISGERLHLTVPVEHRGLRVPIDFFFRSLADDQQERAIGILLSGTGTDGTLGVREIKAAGGMIMVQSPETAQYDGMLRSAIGTGVVDFVLPIGRMPETLLRYVRHGYLNSAPVEPPPERSDHMNAIIGLVRLRTRFDFSGYKKGTLSRRVQRRMGLNHIEDMDAYVEYLRQNKEEVVALHHDLMIGVTNFFREREAWAVLEELVIGPLIKEHAVGVPIRAWVPACATGEEAYSLAILLMEHQRKSRNESEIQIFASDVDTDALAFARAGVYPENIAADVSAPRLRDFFTKGEHTYRINKELREVVVFAEQNVIADPPFSKLDLISCRNLLIYLEPEVQKRVLGLFHFALLDGGYLFLGNSETISPQQDLYYSVSRKQRIFRRTGPTRLDRVENFPPATTRHAIAPTKREGTEPRPRLRMGVAFQYMLQRFAPACAIIDRKGEAVYLNGPVDRYLQLPAGEPSSDLVSMAREGLKNRLRAAVGQAIAEQQRVVVNGVSLRGTNTGLVRVTVEPLREPREAEGLMLVVFEEEAVAAAADAGSASQTLPAIEVEGSETDLVIRRLEEELRTTREDLQTTIEELETSNEEFKAANEEVTSINEELQSTNEELETSKEEMQSLNEELQTVNNQLEIKVTELESANNDLANLLASTEIATLFLDRQHHIRRFTPATRRLLRVIDSDLGRPLADLAMTISDEHLLTDAQQVLEQLVPVEREVSDAEGHWFLRRILPYRTEDDRIDGIVLTYTDITLRKQDEDAVRTLNQKLEHRIGQRNAEVRRLIETAPDGMLVVSHEGIILETNPRAEELFGFAHGALSGAKVETLVPERLRAAHVRHRSRYTSAPSPRAMDPGLGLVGRRSDGSEFAIEVQLTPMELNGQDVTLASVRDVTESQRSEAARARLAAIVRTTGAAILVQDLDGTIEEWNHGAERLFGYTETEAVGRNVTALLSPGLPDEFRACVERLQKDQLVEDLETVKIHKDGSAIDVLVQKSLATLDPTQPPRVLSIISDIRSKRHMQQRIGIALEEERQRVGRELHDTLGQQLAALAMQADLLVGKVHDEGSEAAAVRLKEAAEEAKGNLRSIVRGAFPVGVDAEGLWPALETLAAETQRGYKVRCQLEPGPRVVVEDNFTASQLYLIAREAVSNAVRHAHPQTIAIRLESDGEIRLTVRDDGSGMPTQPPSAVGLSIMRYRSGIIGARFSVSSAPGGGTVITVVRPRR
jgi:two-component system CheB/CheR fusion protein